MGAFVTFENEMSQRRILADYRDQDQYFCCGTPPALLFRGKHRIHVSQADDPSTIAWENVEITDKERCCRSLVANAVLCLVLLLTMVIVIVGTVVSRDTLEKAPDLALCQTVVPGLLFGGQPPGGDWSFVGAAADASSCSRNDTSDKMLSIELSHVDVHAAEQANARAQFAQLAGHDGRCAGTCFGPSDTFECKSPVDEQGGLVDASSSRSRTFVASTVLGCFCLTDFSDQVMDRGFQQAVDAAREQHGGVCLDIATAFLTA